MRRNPTNVRRDTWIGLASYAATVLVLFRVTYSAVGEPLGALLFAVFIGLGAAIPVYLIARFAVAKAVVRLRRRHAVAVDGVDPVPPPMPAESRPEKRFRLARHGSVDPAYGRSAGPAASATPASSEARNPLL